MKPKTLYLTTIKSSTAKMNGRFGIYVKFGVRIDEPKLLLMKKNFGLQN